jgi:hypothetical protein
MPPIIAIKGAAAHADSLSSYWWERALVIAHSSTAKDIGMDERIRFAAKAGERARPVGQTCVAPPPEINWAAARVSLTGVRKSS